MPVRMERFRESNMDETARVPDRIVATDVHRDFMLGAIGGDSGLWSREILDGADVAVLPMTPQELPPPAQGLECRVFLVLLTAPGDLDGAREASLRSGGGTGVACRIEGGGWRVVADPLKQTVLDRRSLNAARALGGLALAQAAEAAAKWPDRPASD